MERWYNCFSLINLDKFLNWRSINMFCQHCGGKIPDGASFCPNCGAPVTNRNSGDYGPRFGGFDGRGVSEIEKSNALGKITKKMKNSATLWTVMGWLQIVFSAYMLISTFVTMASDELLEANALYYAIDIISYILAAVTGIINLGIAKRNKGFVTAVAEKPVGIIEFFEKMNIAFPIVMNLLFGGIVTIIAAIMDSGIKKEALSPQNRRIFTAIESDYNQQTYNF